MTRERCQFKLFNLLHTEAAFLETNISLAEQDENPLSQILQLKAPCFLF